MSISKPDPYDITKVTEQELLERWQKMSKVMWTSGSGPALLPIVQSELYRREGLRAAKAADRKATTAFWTAIALGILQCVIGAIQIWVVK